MEVEALLRIMRGQRKEESKTKGKGRRQPGDKHTVFKENRTEYEQEDKAMGERVPRPSRRTLRKGKEELTKERYKKRIQKKIASYI